MLESASNRKSLREGIHVLRASGDGQGVTGAGGQGVTGNSNISDSNPNNFMDETTTHEDRKISNCSELPPFGEAAVISIWR
jgi:hypothetical protein